MQSNSAPQGYHWCQVALHWLVAVLVASQFATGGSIGRTHDAVTHGLEVKPFDLVLHKFHNRIGLIILGLMLVRLALRLMIGVPNPVQEVTGWRTRLARAAHIGFYSVLIAQASTGAIASYFFWPIGAAHVVLSRILLALIALHASAVLWHAFLLHDGALARMVPWRSSGAPVASHSPRQQPL